jgi:hypothetical protein
MARKEKLWQEEGERERRRPGIGILQRGRGVGRRKENSHVLVIPAEQ